MTMMPAVLDACCGSRMFWFDKAHPAALYMDIRQEVTFLKDSSSRGGVRPLLVCPDVVADFRAMPFCDGVFDVVIFDPPHFQRNGSSGWMAKKYGTLDRQSWRDDLRRGFKECFRVCRSGGTVVFKWNEREISVGDVVSLAPCRPIIGHRFGKNEQSYFVVFHKPRVA